MIMFHRSFCCQVYNFYCLFTVDSLLISTLNNLNRVDNGVHIHSHIKPPQWRNSEEKRQKLAQYSYILQWTISFLYFTNVVRLDAWKEVYFPKRVKRLGGERLLLSPWLIISITGSHARLSIFCLLFINKSDRDSCK